MSELLPPSSNPDYEVRLLQVTFSGNLDKLESRMNAVIKDSIMEVKLEIADLRQEMQSSNAELRQEMQSSNAELRKEMYNSNAELKQSIHNQQLEIVRIQERMTEMDRDIKKLDLSIEQIKKDTAELPTIRNTMVNLMRVVYGTIIVAIIGVTVNLFLKISESKSAPTIYKAPATYQK